MNTYELSGLKTIVLAVDGSEDSWAAVVMLRSLTLPPEVQCNAVHAIDGCFYVLNGLCSHFLSWKLQ